MGSYDKACNDVNAVRFVQQHLKECELIAKQLNVPVENILGLAAAESQYGTGRIAREYNNYFSLHAPASFQSGEIHPHGNRKTRVAIFPSFSICARSFAIKYGNAVRDVKDALAFCDALVKAGFNSGDSRTGGTDNYAKKTADIIIMVGRRMACSVK
ncbi:hypothetical protein GJ200_19710 [Salmonella enterica subsp. enterica]|nr:hypothetical protein [Salmonella enterica]EBX6014547.1 hypothetical protein [Salmonella enterica subsp. enterica serovar Dortmund]ECI6407226.1 hypothetical protein [Salmonella enterica subsp. enterica]EDN7242976.1 hypothetical protein [Salmonella enterica subsp. enterica serovar Thompson]EDS6041241.1 hypothetical protein [Salmonella enterica subsp. enterica serovar Lexington]EEE2004582.1 hypothetical protein [Salmonella enterica subsp. enterica serovar Kotte]EEF3253764.1 hypothetical prote